MAQQVGKRCDTLIEFGGVSILYGQYMNERNGKFKARMAFISASEDEQMKYK